MSNESVTKYYLVEGATKPVEGITFEAFDTIGSILFGIYATSNPAEIATLDAVIKNNPRRGVQELPQSEYESMDQKKIRSSANSPYSLPKPVVAQFSREVAPTVQPPIKGNGAVVDLNPNPPAPEPEVTPASVPVSKPEDALLLGDVAASPTNPPRQSQKGKKA